MAETYDLVPQPVAPVKRPVKPLPPVDDDDDDDDDDSPGGLTLPMPVLIGGGVGVAVVSIIVAVVAVGMFRGGPKGEPAPVASDQATKPPTTQVAAAPKAAPAASETITAPAPIPASEANSAPKPPPTQVAAAPTRPPAASQPAPASPPSSVSVFDAMQTSDVPAPAPEPEPAGETEVAAQARSAAAAVASRDDGAGKTLSTAEIVAESEPSVALVKGKGSSGTGFLVAPGLLATNSHVIDDELISDLEIRFVSADDKHKAPVKGELLYEDPERDLAFLAVKTDLKPLRVAKTYKFRKGEDITVIGNPGIGDGQVLENAISKGVMSTKVELDKGHFYQLGIAINPGNSGGPVFDSSGRVIGVATLKSAKQEATGFSIPIEDVQLALAKLSKESTGDAERCRSRHRILAAVKGLGSGGALMCLIIDLRRAGALTNSAEVKDLLGKLEPVAAELDKDLFPSLAAAGPRIKNDRLVAAPIRSKVGDMAVNFTRIRAAYSSRKNVDDNQLRPWKQTHRRLVTDLAASLKLQIPDGMLTAFDDHAPAQPRIITMGPQGLGMYGNRLRPRLPGQPGGIPRPPSLRDRTRRGGIR